MSKTIRACAVLTACCVVMAVGASPAVAGKKKKKVETSSWTATAPVPFPNNGAFTGINGSCSAGVEGVSKATQTFEAPGNGLVRATIEGFAGDWDLFLNYDGGQVGSLGQQVPFGDAAVETVSWIMKKGETVDIVACNWIGGPETEVLMEFEYGVSSPF